MNNITMEEKKTDAYLLLTVEGSVNLYSYNEFEEKIYAAINETDLVLDCSKITMISSSGLGVLMSAYNDSEEKGHKIYILNPSKALKTAIDSTGFSDMFKIIHSLDEI